MDARKSYASNLHSLLSTYGILLPDLDTYGCVSGKWLEDVFRQKEQQYPQQFTAAVQDSIASVLKTMGMLHNEVRRID
jgi:hypothetical protein